MELFCNRFLSLRTAKGLSLARVAEVIGISPRALKYYAAGEREPSFSTLIALADLFDVSIDYLVGRSDDPQRR